MHHFFPNFIIIFNEYYESMRVWKMQIVSVKMDNRCMIQTVSYTANKMCVSVRVFVCAFVSILAMRAQ